MRPALIALLLAAPAAAQDRPVLNVYAPDYFGSDWGPGPAIEEGFEARCDCDLVFRIGDVLPRLQLEGERTDADIAIGLNGDTAERARETGLFAPHGRVLGDLTMPIDWTDDTFVPFNWGYTAFVYDETRVPEPPESFAALLDAPDDLSVVVQDPRSSISGLALALWMEAVWGDETTRAWERLAPKVLTVTQDWSQSYGLFTSGEADMVLSYTTSPAYHRMEEDDATKHAAIFPEGHYVMVELAGKVAGTDVPDLADQFLDYVLAPEFQALIQTANWAYPAKLPREEWPETFRDLPMPDKTISYDPAEAAARREDAIAAFEEGLR